MPPEASLLEDGEGAFATGVSRYLDFRPGRAEPLSRIYIPFQIAGGDLWQLALVDTRGHFFVPGSDVLELIHQELGESFDQTSLLTASGRIEGELHRLSITLIAVEGQDLQVDTTAFISPQWDGPSILGYTEFLERIRFAVDPERNLFYFGPRS